MNHRFKLLIVTTSSLLVVLLLLGTAMGHSASPEDAYKHLAVYTDVLQHIKSDYVEEPDMKNVTVGALNGLLEALDPYASYLNADQYKQYLKNQDAKNRDMESAINRAVAAGILERRGHSLVHADNGRQGIETLLQNPDIRLVLMDLMMPGMDGYAATGYIRSLDRFAELPIIAVTAKAAPGDRARSLAAGANEHVTKPVDVDALLGIIRSMIGT